MPEIAKRNIPRSEAVKTHIIACGVDKTISNNHPSHVGCDTKTLGCDTGTVDLENSYWNSMERKPGHTDTYLLLWFTWESLGNPPRYKGYWKLIIFSSTKLKFSKNFWGRAPSRSPICSILGFALGLGFALIYGFMLLHKPYTVEQHFDSQTHSKMDNGGTKRGKRMEERRMKITWYRIYGGAILQTQGCSQGGWGFKPQTDLDIRPYQHCMYY